MTGTMLDERLGKIHFWLLFVGFHITFLVQHWLGADGMPRRYADYLAADGFTTLNTISSIGAFLLGAVHLPVPLQRVEDRHGRRRRRRWTIPGAGPLPGVGHLLPAAPAQLPTLPRIRSESPAFDLHHPDIAQLEQQQYTGKRDVIDAPGHESDRS